MILSLANIGYSVAQIKDLILNMGTGSTDVRYDGGWIKDCTQDPCRTVRPARPPAGLFAGFSGTWLDFDFSAVKECFLDGKIRVEGYPLNGGYLLIGSHLYLSGGLTPVNITFETDAGQILHTARYSLEFQNAYSSFYHTYHYFLSGDVRNYGTSVDFLTEFRSFADQKPDEVKGRHVVDVHSLPFVSIGERSGRPSIYYGVSGMAACEFLNAVRALLNYSDSYRFDVCDEGNFIFVELF